MDIETCIYDEKEELPLTEFYQKYKDKLPMTAIVVGGHYGPTKWDDLPSDLVMRIDREFRQQRVLAKDPKSYRNQYISIPVNGPYKFNLVKSSKEKSKDQSMAEILEQHTLPVLVQFSARYEVPREARGPDGGMICLLIEYRHEEIYLQGNFYSQGVIAKESASITLCPLITMAPIHGRKDKTDLEYDQYIQRMTDFVNKQSQFSEKTCNLAVKKLDASDPDISHIVKSEIVLPDSGPAPALPKRKGSCDQPAQPIKAQPVKAQPVKAQPVKAQPIKSSQNKSKAPEVGHAPRLPDRQSAPQHSKSGIVKTSKALPKPIPTAVVSEKEPSDDSDGEIYGGDYEVIDDEKPLEPPSKLNKSTTGYANDILCQVRPFTEHKTKDADDESDEYEEVEEKVTDLKIEGHSEIDKETQKMGANISQTQAHDPYAKSVDIDTIKTAERPENQDNSAQDGDNVKPCFVSGKSIKELGEILVKLRLGKYLEKFAEDLIDGEIVQDLTVDDLKSDYQFTKTEAIRLRKYIEHGHIPQ